MGPLSNTESLKFYAPEMVLSAGILLILVVDLIGDRMYKRKGGVSNRKVHGTLALVTLAVAGAVLWWVNHSTPESEVPRGVAIFGGLLARDAFGDFFKYFFLGVTAVVGLMSMRSRDAIDHTDGDRDAGEYFALTLTTTLGLFMMATATDMLTAFLGLELVSIMGYVLAGFKRRDRKSSEAALKYVIYGGVASGAMLFGLSLLYGLAGTTSLAGIKASAAVAASPTTLITAVTLVLAGFGYKIASVPFHMWCPDVYEGAPTPVTAFLSVGPKAAGFAMLIRFFGGALPETLLAKGALLDASPWPLILGASAAITMTVGNLSALGQQNIKRMFAYSSIAHAGYLLLGLVALSGGGSGTRSILFYLVTYLFMNLGAFLVVIALAETGLGENVEDYKGLGTRSPFIAVVLCIFLFSLTGLPPFAGFAGKFLVFSALLEKPTSMNVFLAILGVVNSAISLYYYARLAKVMFFDKASEGAAPIKVYGVHAATLTVLAVPTIFLGVYWAPLLDAADQAIRAGAPAVIGAARAVAGL